MVGCKFVTRFGAASALAFVGGLASTARGAINYSNNFNDPSATSFGTDFVQNGPNAGNLFEQTTGGLNNSGAVNLTSETGDATAILFGQSDDFSTGTPSYTVSGYFKAQLGVAGGATGAFQIGFGSDTTTSFNGGATFLTARVINSGALQFQTGDGANGTTNTGTSSPATITDKNFYFLTATLTKTSTANTFAGTASLYDADPTTGAIGANPLVSISSSSLLDPSIYNDPTVYAGFRAAGGTNLGTPGTVGVNVIDNFSVTAAAVPEPASVGLLVASAALLGIRRRR